MTRRGPETDRRIGVPAHGGSAAGPVLRELRRRFRLGIADIGPQNHARWKRTVALGAVLLIAWTLLLVFVARWMVETGRLEWEADALRWLEADGPLKFSSAVFFQTFGTDITLIFLIGATAGIAAWNRRSLTALSILLAPLGADLAGRLAWAVWGRARPDILYDGIASPGLHSFPSGHTSKALALYGMLVFLWLRHSRSLLEKTVGVVLLGFIAAIVPLGRVTMGVHWPSDVVGGWLVGIFWLGVLVWALRFEHRADAAGAPD